MPPRSKKAADADAVGDDEPRRSSRIKDQPKKAAPTKKVAKPRKKKEEKAAEEKADGDEDSKKRAADEEHPDEPAPKKAKAGSVKPVSKGGSKPASKVKASEDKENDGKVPETILEESEESVEIAVGDSIPDVQVKNDKDESVSAQSLVAEKGAVFFVFPKADTPGCNKQACAFRDNYEEFTKLGYKVYGLSGDTAAAQTKWQKKNNITYEFISDPKKELIKALGAFNKTIKRSHFVVEKGGKLLDKKIPVQAEKSYSLALEFIKTLQS